MSPKWYANYYDSFGQALEDKDTPVPQLGTSTSVP